MLIRAMLDDPALPARFATALRDPAAEVHVSAVPVREVAIRRAPGRLTVPPDLFDQAMAAGCRPLPVTWTHARAVEALPPHHAAPFDRMLVAQARAEGLTLLSADRQMLACDVTRL